MLFHLKKKYSGLVFIGDPHLWSKKPGYRIEENFTDIVLNKLQFCITYCKKNNLYPIILGDLFHTDKENDITLLTKLARILNQLDEPAATVSGNHEISQTEVSDDVALALLKESNLIHIISNGLWATININGEQVLIGSTPYGKQLPTEIIKPKEHQTNKLFWITHHDLDFGDTYPGVIPIPEIKNVDFLVNGHIHKTKPAQKVGQMIAFNPGNILRLSTDCSDHIPRIWTWSNNQTELNPVEIPHSKHVFLKIGDQIKVEKQGTIVDDLQPEHVSQFVKQLEADNLTDEQEQTDDGVYIKKSISLLGKAMEIEPSFMEEILAIAEETISQMDNT